MGLRNPRSRVQVPPGTKEKMKLLELIEEKLLEELDPKVKLVLETGKYLIEGGGKRIRPLITSLSCGMCGGDPEDAIPLGIGIEYIHAASLLHDDVVDGAESRRGKPSANLVFGNGIAVLTGDFMYAKALNIFATHGDIIMIRIVSKSVMEMAQAQVLELSNIGEIIDSDTYFKIIDGKTSSLFGASMAVGGLKAGYEDWPTLYEIGIRIGRAFQIIDDVLDYEGNPEKLGKPTSNDLKEGKVTYPLISVMDKIPNNLIREVIEEINPDPGKVEELRNLVIEEGGTVKARNLAKEEVNKALHLLETFPDNIYKDEVISIIEFVIGREL